MATPSWAALMMPLVWHRHWVLEMSRLVLKYNRDIWQNTRLFIRMNFTLKFMEVIAFITTINEIFFYLWLVNPLLCPKPEWKRD